MVPLRSLAASVRSTMRRASMSRLNLPLPPKRAQPVRPSEQQQRASRSQVLRTVERLTAPSVLQSKACGGNTVQAPEPRDRHRPQDMQALQAAARTLHAGGLTPLDIAELLGLTEAAVRELLQSETLEVGHA